MKHFSLLVIAALFSCCACREPLPAAEGPHPMMIRFEKDGAEEYFNVAVRDSVVDDAFIVCRLRHYCDHGEFRYMDLWRIDWAYRGLWNAETSSMTKVLDKILTDGESECVVKDYGLLTENGSFIDTYDFTGGFHGDERIDLEPGCGVSFVMDGQVIPSDKLSASFGWTECDSFAYEQNSTLHKTALKIDGREERSDHHVIADHKKTTVFGDGGYETRNTLTMRDEIHFFWYFGICCAGTSVADYGCSADGKEVRFNRSGATVLASAASGDYHAWSYYNGTEIYVHSQIDDEQMEKQSRMHIWDTGNYAKYYRRYPGTGPHKTAPGECFSSYMKVKFKCLW